MKELTGQAINMMACEVRDKDGQRLAAFPEIIVIVSEPKYGADVGGLKKTRQVSEFRFATTTSGLREFAKILLEYADDADEWMKGVTGGKKAKGKQPDLPTE